MERRNFLSWLSFTGVGGNGTSVLVGDRGRPAGAAIIASLLDIAKLATIVPSQTTVAPGELITARLALPLPGDSPALGDSGYTVDVTWLVATAAPATDGSGFVTPFPPGNLATLGADFIAPQRLDQLLAVFGLKPLVGGTPPTTKPYWLIAKFTLRRPGDTLLAQPSQLTLSAAKVSPPINALGLSDTDLADRLHALFKIEMPTTPLEAGAPLTARLRPRGAEDSQWDVESASEVIPRYELDAKVQLDPLFKPVGRIVNGVFGITNQILSAGVRLLVPLVRVMAAVEGGVKKLAGAASSLLGRKNPLRDVNPAKEVERLLRRIRVRDIDLFKGLVLPIDADILNRNFTTNLVPRDSVPPLPGPSGLLPKVPSLEQQLELSDQFPEGISALPLVGSLQIPLSINRVTWELWRPDVTVDAAGVPLGASTIKLAGGDAAKLPANTPFWLVIWNSTDNPDGPAGATEVVRVDNKGIPDLDTLSVTRGQHNTSAISHTAAGKTYKMRLTPVAQLIPGPQGYQKEILGQPTSVEVTASPYAAGVTTNIQYAGPNLPAATPFWATWWNRAFADPAADPGAEIILVMAHDVVTKRLTTVRRGQYGTTDANHNTAGATYGMRVASLPAAVSVAQGYGAAATDILLTGADAARLPRPPFYAFWWNTSDYPEPAADPNAEVVQITNVNIVANKVNVVRARYATSARPHNLANKSYRMQLVADYFEIGHTAGRALKKSFVIEPPLEPESVIQLHVRLDSIIDPSSTALPQNTTLQPLPIRLAGFDPFAFIAQQLELTVPAEPVEPGDEAPVQLTSPIPLESVSATNIHVPLSLGELPSRTLQISTTWEVLGENGEPLTEGNEYTLTGGTATTRSILLVPPLQIMRREGPAPSVRFVRVRLTTERPRLTQTLGPVPLLVSPLQLPVFVALFRRRFFRETGADAVQVLMPSFYVTQAPNWVESWEDFQARLNEMQDRIVKLLAVAGGTPTSPPAAGSAQRLPPLAVRRLTLLRGILDYVANRPETGKLSFMRSGGAGYFATPQLFFVTMPGIATDPFRDAETAIVVNDATVSLLLTRTGQFGTVSIGCTPTNPICVLWRETPIFAPGGGWSFSSIPKGSPWTASETVNVTTPGSGNWAIAQVSVTFDQILEVNNSFPSPAGIWSPPS